MENIRVRNLCGEDETTYIYDTNAKLSRLLIKITNGVLTKYVYGRGLIGEETNGEFKTYHFDSRGSTVAITDEQGNITDTFAYDTYGKVIGRTGTSDVIFQYNGRDGVITEPNGLIYMRARYYSPELRRFINADIVAGTISDSTSLNRYAYVNGNPVSFVDPFGLSANPAQFSTKIMTDGGSGKDKRGNDTNNITTKNNDPNYNKAILVSNFNYSFPINITGHTQLYFWDNANKKWYITEFSGSDKSNARVRFKQIDDPEMFPNKAIDGINYVVLNGDFNDSVALARKYESDGFGRYNFLFHNCSDYTNKLLDDADINGMFSQILSEGNLLISIPILREFSLSVSSGMDSVTSWISNGLIDIGDSIQGSNFVGNIAGNVLVGTGILIDQSTNFMGDAIDFANDIVGEGVDGIKKVASAITNAMVDGWNTVSNWFRSRKT